VQPDGRAQRLPGSDALMLELAPLDANGKTMVAIGYHQADRSTSVYTSADQGWSWQRQSGQVPVPTTVVVQGVTYARRRGPVAQRRLRRHLEPSRPRARAYPRPGLLSGRPAAAGHGYGTGSATAIQGALARLDSVARHRLAICCAEAATLAEVWELLGGCRVAAIRPTLEAGAVPAA
jgi:hypothetical protein